MSAPASLNGLQGVAFNRPKDWQAFERLIRDLAAAEYGDVNAEQHGRSGQNQTGVDILCRASDGRSIGLQCKHLEASANRPISEAALLEEIEKAKACQPPIDHFIVVMTAPNDVKLQGLARRVSEENTRSGKFLVDVHGWDWVESQLRLWPTIAKDYGLIMSLGAPATSPTAQVIGRRFVKALGLLNTGRLGSDQIGLTEIAEALSHSDWVELESLAQGGFAGPMTRLGDIATGLGLSREWLIHGKEAPFRIDRGSQDAGRQYDEIMASEPQRVMVIRNRAAPFNAAVMVHSTALCWRVFETHPAGPAVGGTGRHQLFEFACLLRRLFKSLFRQSVELTGQHLDGETFQALLDGELYPGSVADWSHNDPWWQDLAQFDEDGVKGRAPEAIALRAAIGVAHGVLDEYWQPGRDAAWKMERLLEAGLPKTRPRSSRRFLVDLGSDRLPRKEAAHASSWPKIAALSLRDARFSFTASADGTLLDGMCHLDVENRTKVALERCGVFVVAIRDGPVRKVVGAYLHAARHQPESAEGFPLAQGQMRRLNLCTRELKDIISRPPWLLRLDGRDWPLFDGHRYVLELELRSNYQFPTKVQVALAVDQGKAVGVEILDQSV